MSIPRTLIDCLNTNKIPYEILPHTVAFTARMAAAAEHIASRYQAKVVMVGSEKGPVMTVLPADRKLDLRKVERLTHARAVLQSETDFTPFFPDCETGAMPPFGNLYGLATYVDQHLAEVDYIVFEAEIYTEAIKVNYRDYERAVKPEWDALYELPAVYGAKKQWLPQNQVITMKCSSARGGPQPTRSPVRARWSELIASGAG